MIVSALSALAAFNIAVLIRGSARLLAAWLTGAPISRVAVGLGWELFGWTSPRGTRWGFRPLLIGGYVVMAKAAGAAQHSRRELASRAVVLAAGPAANLLFPVLLFAGFYLFVGAATFPPLVQSLTPNGPAARAGLQPADRLVSIDAMPLKSFDEFAGIVRSRPGEEVIIQVRRGAATETVAVQLGSEEIQDRAGHRTRIGVAGVRGPALQPEALEYRRLSLPNALLAGANDTLDNTVALARLSSQTIGFFGERTLTPTDAGPGPIRIARPQQSFDLKGFAYVAALFSIAVGLFNLLPLTIFDGGKLTLTAVEAVTRHPLATGVEKYLRGISLAILAAALLSVGWRLLSAWG